MVFDIKLPRIDAPTEKERIEQIRSYLFQTIREINWALNSIDTSNAGIVESKEVDGGAIFSVLKPMIIRSADIINAYYDIFFDRADDNFAKITDLNSCSSRVSTNESAIEQINTNYSELNASLQSLLTAFNLLDGEFTIHDTNIAVNKPLRALQMPYEISGSVTEYALTTTDGITKVITTDTTIDLPEGYQNLVGEVIRSGNNLLIQLTDFLTGTILTNAYVEEAWLGWNIFTAQ